jgi:hypothetical protein
VVAVAGLKLKNRKKIEEGVGYRGGRAKKAGN